MYKIGDKVIDTANGNIGTITDFHRHKENTWWVDWETGNFAGHNLSISESCMKHET